MKKIYKLFIQLAYKYDHLDCSNINCKKCILHQHSLFIDGERYTICDLLSEISAQLKFITRKKA